MEPKKGRKHKSFADFIMNDDRIVMKLLMNSSYWVGLLFCAFMVYAGFVVENYWLVGIFGIAVLAQAYNMYKFYFILGGNKALEGVKAGKTVWNKDFKFKR